MAYNTFMWHEHRSEDQGKSAACYSKLFIWQLQSRVTSTDKPYIVASRFERPVAGFRGVLNGLSGWLGFIPVQDISAFLVIAKECGGSIVVDKYLESGIGDAAVLADPGGAIFGVYQPKAKAGIGFKSDALGNICWNELVTNNPMAAMGFYSEVFGWEFAKAGEHNLQPYWTISLADRMIGGMILGNTDTACWLPYVKVKDVNANINEAEKNCFSVCQPKLDIPYTGSVALILDASQSITGLFDPTTA